ncbi:hypothetical protein [Rahnella inusitata]|uniref:hypothetical protein n=1 Tax=Rahnella inusitata TaxID=58169 RepID=UPI0039B12687
MKPSYEELEEQLNRSRRLCDAALANERVWETAMMQACGEDGPKSVADKFAELQAKCAALAAEGSVMKSAIDTTIGWQQSTDPENGESVRMLVDIKTPATDAFIAEVRAQGVEMFAQALRGEAEITKACTFKPVQQFEEFAARADECAAKLRQDANTAELVAAGIITKVGE